MELAQTGFNDLGVLCQAIRDACDQQTNPYHLAGIGLYLADEWVNTLDGELEALRALRQPQPTVRTVSLNKQKPRSVRSGAFLLGVST
ncbi:MAG: hypothetical protein G8D90_04340 [gamma proteobacterium symbiont of Clathrolucina costata]|nr:hypothetical protein [Candidatus Thiodiazotropha endolucinida]